MTDYDFNKITSEKAKPKHKVSKEIAENKDEEGFPHKCKKCKHEGAEVTDLGIGWSDESSRFLFKCKKCGYVERYAEGPSNA